jgi:multiple sugar transport system substrate-binding protein
VVAITTAGRSSIVRVALVGGPMYDPLYAAIPAFEKEVGVRVEIAAQLPHPELNAFVAQAFEAGVHLDLISTHTKYAPFQAPWLLPLDELIGRESVDDLLARPAELSRIDGQLLQVPRNLDIRLLHYRRDCILAAPSTWTELIETAGALSRQPSNGAPGFYGFLFPGRDSGLFGMFYELLVSAGGELFDEDLQPAFDSDAGRWALEQIVDLHLHRLVTPRDLAHWHYDEISASFRSGHAAMVSDWPGSHHLYRTAETCRVADRTDLALLPEGPARKRAAYAGCHSFAIPRTAHNPQLAAALAAYLTSSSAQVEEARRGAIPCRASALAAFGAEIATVPADARRWELLKATEETMIIPPRFASYPQCETVLWRNLQAAMLGARSAAEALRQAAADVLSIVAEQAPTR